MTNIIGFPSFHYTKIETKNCFLRPPQPGDFQEWVTLRENNRTRLQPYEPAWSKNWKNNEIYHKRLNRQKREWENDLGYALLIFLKETHKMIGGTSLNHVCRGAAQFAHLGYWIDGAHEGLGLMRDVLKGVCDFSWDAVNLQRLHAGCLPENARSITLLKAAGFEEEGKAKAYAEINGNRQTHILFGLNRQPE